MSEPHQNLGECRILFVVLLDELITDGAAPTRDLDEVGDNRVGDFCSVSHRFPEPLRHLPARSAR